MLPLKLRQSPSDKSEPTMNLFTRFVCQTIVDCQRVKWIRFYLNRLLCEFPFRRQLFTINNNIECCKTHIWISTCEKWSKELNKMMCKNRCRICFYCVDWVVKETMLWHRIQIAKANIIVFRMTAVRMFGFSYFFSEKSPFYECADASVYSSSIYRASSSEPHLNHSNFSLYSCWASMSFSFMSYSYPSPSWSSSSSRSQSVSHSTPPNITSMSKRWHTHNAVIIKTIKF